MFGCDLVQYLSSTTDSRHELHACKAHTSDSCSSATVQNNASVMLGTMMVLNSAGKTRSYPRRLSSLQVAAHRVATGSTFTRSAAQAREHFKLWPAPAATCTGSTTHKPPLQLQQWLCTGTVHEPCQQAQLACGREQEAKEQSSSTIPKWAARMQRKTECRQWQVTKEHICRVRLTERRNGISASNSRLQHHSCTPASHLRYVVWHIHDVKIRLSHPVHCI